MRRPRRAISVRFLLISVGAILAADAIVVALLIKPPPIGWVGFAVVAAIVLSLAALIPIAFERTRVSPRLPARAHDGDERLLVVADPLCDEALLCEAVVARRGRAGVHVVVPMRVSSLHFLTDDESAETLRPSGQCRSRSRCCANAAFPLPVPSAPTSRSSR